MTPSALLCRPALLLLLLASAPLMAETTGQVTSGNTAGPTSAHPADPATAEEPPREPDLPLVDKFARPGEHRLDAAGRQAARDYLAHHPQGQTSTTGHVGTLRPPPVALEPVYPGAKLSPATAPAAPAAALYDPQVVRTLFLEFPEQDWEQQLADFSHTDVLVPARLTLDGHVYEEVGVRFRAPDAPAGYKRTLQLMLDPAHPEQAVGGQRELWLRPPQNDATFVRSLLYHRIATDTLFAPAAALVRVVLNGEDWGIYLNTQPVDDRFVQAHFGTAAGARWTAAPGANLADLGSDPAAYRRTYRLQTPEAPAAWAALVHLSQVLNQTPPDQLEAALAPLLDLDNAVRFLALENTFVNQDGYWSRGGGFTLYLDPAGRFHFIPLEAGTVLQYPQVAEYVGRDAGGGGGAGGSGGRGRRGGERGGGKEKDPENSPEVKAYQRSRDFPKQATTDLAMILSYSFVNKADRNDDRKLTRDELLDFIRSWFIIIDEDAAGAVTREQFIAKFRNFLAPPSLRDGRSRQTYGKTDAPAAVGGDLFDAMDTNHDGQLTREEFIGAFDRWFTAWNDPKTKLLTEDGLYQGLNKILTQTVFQADQSYIATNSFQVQPENPAKSAGEGNRGGGGRRGNSSDGTGGVSANVGIPGLHLPVGGGKSTESGGSGGGSPSVVYRAEVLTPLRGAGVKNRPLLAKLLAVPALRDRYLVAMYELTEKWLQWSVLGPLAQEYRNRITAEVKQETHAPTSYARFVQQLDQDAALAGGSEDATSLKTFVTTRHAYLLEDPNLRRAIGAR